MINPGVPVRFSVPDLSPTTGSRDTQFIKNSIWIGIITFLMWILCRYDHPLILPVLLYLGDRFLAVLNENMSKTPPTNRDRLLLRAVYWGSCLIYILPSYY